jgi:glucose/arabinose dehydrogenase
MRRIRNLAVFGITALVLFAAIAWFLRSQLSPLLGVNLDAGPGGRAELSLPAGYSATVFAEGLSNPRFMAVSSDGVLFVAERGADRVIALPDTDGNGVADDVVDVGIGYGAAHDIEFTDDGSLLVAGEETLHAVVLEGLREIGRTTMVDGLPTGGHASKTVEVLPDRRILLSIGSSCDVCEEEDARRATVQQVDDGALRPVMIGLRNAVGLWVDDESGRAWATNMGRDRLGDDRPPETVFEVVDGADAGWPRCHAGTLPDPEFGDAPDACDGVAMPAVTLPAHTAPLALVEWRDHLVIALHGSWNSSSKVGYKLVWLPWSDGPAGPVEDFATGFLPDGAQDASGRPAGLAVGLDGALYVSDDKAGFIYRIVPPAG